MVRYVSAWYVGCADLDYPFIKSHIYSLAIKTRWWSKKVTVYQRHGYYDDMLVGTHHQFNTHESFSKCWQIIKEEE